MGFEIENGVLKKYTEEDGVTEVVIPDGVIVIEESAFDECESLTSITIPESVKSIGRWAFTFCESLISINVSDNNKFYSTDNGILFNKNKTDLITYPAGKKNTEYIIPESVMIIGNNAFSNCKSLESIIIPDSVKTIGNSVFSNCESLTGITIPENVTSIGDSSFYFCTSLKSIKIPESATDIGDEAFFKCKSLTSITIPDNVTSIGDRAFSYCESLTGIKIPEGITSIGEKTFYKCTSLTSITIPESVTNIGGDAFEDTPWLENYPDDFVIINGILYEYKGDDSDVIIPEGVTSIEDMVFFLCESLTSITIPESVTSIGEHAFEECTSLTCVKISEGVKTIGGWCFYDCESLESITIPESVKTIGGWCFYDCESLKSITIPEDVRVIGKYAFDEGKRITFNENGVSYTIKLEGDWNDEDEEHLLNDFILRRDNSRRQNVFTEMEKSNYKIPLAIFMMSAYDDEFFKEYISNNFSDVMEYIIDNDDITMLLQIFETGFLTKENIGRYIDYADGRTEFHTALINYKHDNFGI